MAYGYIQALYILAFGLFLSRQGFNWKWFLPLAGAFMAATLLTVSEFGGGLLPGSLVSPPGDRRQLAAAPMMLIFYPIHAFVTVKVMSHLPPNLTGLQRTIVAVVVYLGAALSSGFIWTVLMMGIFMIFVQF